MCGSIHAEYPDPPLNTMLTLSNSPMSILVDFSRSDPHEHCTVTSYCLLINQHPCTQLQVTAESASQNTFCAIILPKDVLHLEKELTSAPSVELTILALAGDHKSIPSAAVPVPREYLARLLLDHEGCGSTAPSGQAEAHYSLLLDREGCGSTTSSGQAEAHYSPEEREIDLQLIHSTKMESSTGRDHVIQTSNHMTNGVTERRAGWSAHCLLLVHCADPVPVYWYVVRYFRAQYSYDPQYQSPNQEEGVDEELTFNEGDIIVVSSSATAVDSDRYGAF